MTSFKEYLSEAKKNTPNYLEMLEKLQLEDRCGPFISANRASLQDGKILRRLMGESSSDLAEKFKLGMPQLRPVRTNRRPRDSRLEVHNLTDAFFKEKFGYNYRSGAVFTQKSDKFITPYSDFMWAIFPVGQYTLCYSKAVADLAVKIDTDISMTAHADFAKWLMKQKSTYGFKMTSDVTWSLVRLIFSNYLARENQRNNLLSFWTETYNQNYDNWKDFVYDENFVTCVRIAVSNTELPSTKAAALFDRILFDYLGSLGYKESKTYSDVKGQNEIMIKTEQYIAIPLVAPRAFIAALKEYLK
jgi:hypothetical protein